MGDIIWKCCDLKEFRMRVNLPSPIRKVWDPIQHVIPPIQGLPNPIRQVVPLISHIRSYPSHCSHPDPPSPSFSSTTLTSLQNTKLSYPSLSLRVMIMSWHRVHHTPSTPYTESPIRRVQHTRSTQDRSSSLHSHNYELTPECSSSIQCASPNNWATSASFPCELKGKVTLSHTHSCELPKWWIASQHPVRIPSTASKFLSRLARSWPPSISPNSLDYCLPVHFQTHSITASKCISKLTRLQPPSSSPNLFNYGLQMYLQTWSITACKFSRSQPRSAFRNSLDYSLQTHMITASKCISKLARLQPTHSHDLGLHVHVHSRSITVSKFISKLAPLWSPGSQDYGL